MSSRSFKKGTAEDVRSNIDIVDVISEYVTLSTSGQNLKGLCPFHNEKTPSFSVSQDKQLYYCFGCSTGGDVFDFLMRMENIEFPDALNVLAEKAGIEITSAGGEKGNSQFSEKKRLYRVCELAVEFFTKCLAHSRIGCSASEYLNKRGIDQSLINSFNLGYAPNMWDGIIKFFTKRKVPLELAEKAGLVGKRQGKEGYYDKFRNRVMFHINDDWGRPVGFGGRVLDNKNEGPKYLNSPQTIVFDKGKLLFGLKLAKDEMKRTGRAILVEGYTDVIACHKYGVVNSVASLGTSFTEGQGKLLLRYAKEVVIAYDGDTAGTRATLRGMDILKNCGARVRVLSMPKGQDPDEFLSKYGRDGFNNLLDNALDLIDYKLNSVFKKANLSSIQGKVNGINGAVGVLIEISNEVERNEYIKKCAAYFHVDEGSLRQEVKKRQIGKRKVTDRFEKFGNNKDKYDNKNNNVGYQITSSLKKAQKDLIKCMIKKKDIRDNVKSKLQISDFQDEACRNIANILWSFKKEEDAIDAKELSQSLKSNEDRQTLSEILMVEGDIEDSFKTAKGCLDYIRRHNLEERKDDLDKKIKNAEKEGRFDEIQNYLKEYQQIENEYRTLSSFKGIS